MCLIVADEEMCPEKMNSIMTISLLVRTIAGRGKDIERTDGINILSTVLPLSTSKIPGYYILKDIRRFSKVEGRRQPNRELRTQGMTQF